MKIFNVFAESPFYPAHHIAADCSEWTVPTLWNSLHEKVLKSGKFCNLFCKGSQCFDRPDYRMSTICPAKLWKTLFCPRYVSLLKKHRLIVLFTSDAMYKKYKWLDYISPDLLARFRQVNLSNTKKFCLIFYFGLPFRQRNATYKLQMCQLANLLWSRAIMALDHSRLANWHICNL